VAHAADFIEDLPARYDTLVGECGHNFSGGEIQRIALARALLRDAPLLLLDEPTASLDLESEDLITRAIDEISHTHTVITIAHRLDTVRQADRILVFDQGRIVEQGNHDALCNHGGLYAHLAGIYGAATQRRKDGS
jgi:ATP-binding cassette subfamily C protein CydD